MKEMWNVKSERVGREVKTRCEGGAKSEEIPSLTVGFLLKMECSKWLREPLWCIANVWKSNKVYIVILK